MLYGERLVDHQCTAIDCKKHGNTEVRIPYNSSSYLIICMLVYPPLYTNLFMGSDLLTLNVPPLIIRNMETMKSGFTVHI